ncbi:MAG: flagellar hook-basal body complex protein, partial [Geminicoccaceae bacterium]
IIQVATAFDVAFFEQDGTEVGEVSNVLVDDEGFVEVAFTNGQRRRLYRVPIATFSNPLALEPRSGNNYAATDAAGDPNLNIPGVADSGRITPSALELANVDLADEFSKMIVTQRAYSANARVVTTADEMLDELIRISR